MYTNIEQRYGLRPKWFVRVKYAMRKENMLDWCLGFVQLQTAEKCSKYAVLIGS